MPEEIGFWTNKTVLVTGGGGFLGQHVVAKLRAAGCEKIIAPRKREYDLREREQIVRLLKCAKPDLVIHLAAVVGGKAHCWKRRGETRFSKFHMLTLVAAAARGERASPGLRSRDRWQ